MGATLTILAICFIIYILIPNDKYDYPQQSSYKRPPPPPPPPASQSGLDKGSGLFFRTIQTAIYQNKDIEFDYKKPKERSYTRRHITPYRFTRIMHKSGLDSTLCVEGFCHLRNETRTFALKRMKDICIL